MSAPESPAAPVFHHEIVVPQDAIDGNGHVNNVAFVQWMQDVAVRHFNSAAAAVAAMHAAAATWVVRSHHIEYLAPAFAGDRIDVATWIVDFSRVRSLRRYRFVRTSDQKLIVRGETDWVFVAVKAARPVSIPRELREQFTPVPEA